MKADCPRAFKSCTIKLSSRTPGQSDTAKGKDFHKESRCWDSQGAARQELECRGRRVGTAQPFLGNCCAQRQPPQLWGCSNREQQWLQRGLRQGHSTDVSSAALCLPYCTAIRKGKAVCLQELLQAGHACSAIRFCTKPLSGIQGRSTLTCSNDSLLGMFFTATRLNHMQSLVISTPTWFSLAQDLFL